MVDVQDFPKKWKEFIFTRFCGHSNDSVVQYHYLGNDIDEEFCDYLRSIGVKTPDGIHIKYWW